MADVNNIPDVLRANILWHFDQIAVQVSHADNVKGRAKSGYYKVAMLLASSVVEALAHFILKEELEKGSTIPAGPWECYECYDLPSIYQTGTETLAICKRRKSTFQLTDKTDFARVNDICKQLGIFNGAFYKKIENVRTMRNKIHLQGLSNIDRSYNKKNLDAVGYVMNKLIDMIL